MNRTNNLLKELLSGTIGKRNLEGGGVYFRYLPLRVYKKMVLKFLKYLTDEEISNITKEK